MEILTTSMQKIINAKDYDLTMKEELMSALRGILQAIPYVGSSIDELYFGRNDQRKLKKLEEFTLSFAQELSNHEKRLETVEHSHFATDDFAYVIEEIYRLVPNEVSREKIDALRGALVSSILDSEKYEIEIQKNFIKTIDIIGPTHIRVLYTLFSHNSSSNRKEYLSVNNIYKSLNAGKEYEKNFIYSSLDTLANKEFILCTYLTQDKNGGIDKPNQTFRITELGIKFLEYIRYSKKK